MESMAGHPVLMLLITLSANTYLTSAMIRLKHIGVVADNIKDAYSVIRELKRLGVPFTMVSPEGPMPAHVNAAIACGEWRGTPFDSIVDYRGDARRSVLESLSLAAGRREFREVVVGIDPGECVGFATIADGELIEAYTLPKSDAKGEARRIAGVYPSERMRFRIGAGSGIAYSPESLPGGARIIIEYVEEASARRRLLPPFWRKGLRKDAKSALGIALGGPIGSGARR